MTVEERVRQQFEGATREHQLTVIHEDGLYRHLRCQKPGTWIYGFDVVTWPGYLAICGDVGAFMFSRVRDMLEFFEAGGRINPGYWGEKLQGPGNYDDNTRRFSPDLFRTRATAWFEEIADTRQEVGEWTTHFREARKEEFHREVVARADDGEHEARRALIEWGGEYGFGDLWELDFREYDHQFLFCCHAIVWAIARYRLQSADALTMEATTTTREKP